MIKNFKNLTIWTRSRTLVKTIYKITKQLPEDEKFGLISQMRRAAVSIPSNIAEGCGRNTAKNLSHFLDIAVGSNCELETQLYLSYDLEYITEKEMKSSTQEIIEIRKMIISFQNKL